MRFVDYNIDVEIVENLPNIILEISYQDEFSNDHYTLRSNANLQEGTKNIPFNVIKNGEMKESIVLKNRNVKKMISELFDLVNDIDFKEESEKNKLCENISYEVNDFLERYDNIVVSTEIVIEGELKRMKKMAGLL